MEPPRQYEKKGIRNMKKTAGHWKTHPYNTQQTNAMNAVLLASQLAPRKNKTVKRGERNSQGIMSPLQGRIDINNSCKYMMRRKRNPRPIPYMVNRTHTHSMINAYIFHTSFGISVELMSPVQTAQCEWNNKHKPTPMNLLHKHEAEKVQGSGTLSCGFAFVRLLVFFAVRCLFVEFA